MKKKSLLVCVRVVLFVSVVVGAIEAQASVRSTIDDLQYVSLIQKSHVIQRDFHYPGINGPGGFDNPDCLLLAAKGGTLDRERALELLSEIEVADGDGVLFDDETRERNILRPEEKDGKIFLRFQDLGKYVTGLSIQSKSGAPLRSLAEPVMKQSGLNFLGFQLLRGCKGVL